MSHDRVEAVERALTLLEAFGQSAEDQLSLAELAARTGYYKSTILRLSRSLERFGYLTRSPGGGFRLGPSLWRLGSRYRRDFDLGESVRPLLRRLRDALGETASFFVRDGELRVCLYRLNATRGIIHNLEEGAQLPLDKGAAGRVLRAYGGEAGEAYDVIRGQGYCLSRGERDPEIAAVAVPVLSADGALRGALAVSGPISRFDDDLVARSARLLGEVARELSHRLSGP
jgi:DNA-binding IclR family transcriptional regulator